MLKKTVEYEDFNGVTRKEDFYFNLTESECLELQMGMEGGLVEYIEKLIASTDPKSILEIFKDIVMKAYGVKSADGRRFIKTPEVKAEFSETPAYSIIFMELATDDKKAAEFINGIVPNKKSDKSIPAPTN